ncbi:hypothetical protein BDU57DRAFT_587544 [Ampelomyces quisqualis]|uniref:Uncharacterized protein n=1 Tax=Ampelomyces quisqualis TaxID=50730 RepID=A0A6A5QLW1_AMPQU|nr:hypothetical protein BDU57DRAFT_587544 [Ampelomyces quisqualis]
MAHNCGTGTFRDTVYSGSGASTGSAALRGHVESPSPSSLTSDLRATAPDFVPHLPPSVVSDSAEVKPLPQSGSITEFLGPVKYELDMYGLPWAYYMYQVQLAYDQGFRSGRSRSPRKVRQKKHRSCISSPADTTYVQKAAGQESLNAKTMPPPVSTVPLAVQRATQQQHGTIESANEAVETLREADAEPRSASPFAAQKGMIDRHYAFHNLTVTDRAPPGFDLTTIRNVGLPNGPHNIPPQASLTNTMPSRGRSSYDNNRRSNNRSDNGLYTYHNRGVAGVRMHDTVPFPDPVPPQGRPVGSVGGSETCEAVNVVYAAERVAGKACYGCEPDHPLE